MSWRILHSDASLGWGGQEIRVWTELLAMRDSGHTVFLAAPADAILSKKAQEAGIEVVPFSAARTAYPLSILRLSRWMKKRRIQVVNMHSSRDGYIAGVAARLAGIPCIIRSRHIDVDYPNPTISRIGFRWIPHHVTTTSEKIARRLREELGLPDSFTSAIPTGIDLQRFSPDCPPMDLGVYPEIKPSGKKIGMISVLRSWKGHRDFLKAAEKLHATHPSLHFVIAGEGPMEELIRKWITDDGLEEKVTMTGQTDNVPGLLKNLDLLVLPSTAHEGIPQIVLQAQACGVPVVATRVGGIPEVVEDGSTGLLVEPGQPEHLAEAIRTALDDPALLSRLSENGLKQARQAYGLDIMCQKTEAVYERFLRHLNTG